MAKLEFDVLLYFQDIGFSLCYGYVNVPTSSTPNTALVDLAELLRYRDES